MQNDVIGHPERPVNFVCLLVYFLPHFINGEFDPVTSVRVFFPFLDLGWVFFFFK